MLPQNTEGRLVNTEVPWELDKHNFATIMLRIGSGKRHQWMPPFGEPDGDQGICLVLKGLSVDCLLVSRENKDNYHVVEK